MLNRTSINKETRVDKISLIGGRLKSTELSARGRAKDVILGAPLAYNLSGSQSRSGIYTSLLSLGLQH